MRKRERENEGSSWHDSHSFENFEPRRFTYSPTLKLVDLYIFILLIFLKYFFYCYSLTLISSVLSLLPLKNVGQWMAWFVKFCGQCVRLSFSTSSDILLKIGVSPLFSRARCITMYFFSFAPFFQSPLCLLFVVGTLTSLIASDQLLNERKEKDPLT